MDLDRRIIKKIAVSCMKKLGSSTNALVNIEDYLDVDNRLVIDYVDAIACEVKKSRKVFSVKVNNSILSIYTKPCKEFFQLTSWLNKYGNILLPFDSVCYQRLFGKRSWCEVRSETYLCYQPNECKNYLSVFRKHRKTNDIFKLYCGTEKYYGDRFNGYGEDRECEWDGSYSNRCEIEILSPSGKNKCKIILSCY